MHHLSLIYLQYVLDAECDHLASNPSPPNDIAVYLINASGRTPVTYLTPDLGFGGLVPRDMSVCHDGFPFTHDDYEEFRQHGPRMSIDDLDASLEESYARVYNSVFTISDHDASVNRADASPPLTLISIRTRRQRAGAPGHATSAIN